MPRINTGNAFLAALPISVVYAFYRGFHATSIWAVNYYQVGYFDGFYRRALLGALLTPFGCLRFDFFFIESIQFLVLFAALGLLLYYGVKNREYPVLTIFFISAAGGYFFDEVGYPEQFLWLLAAATLYALKHNRNFLAVATMCLAVMVHEMALLMVLPLALAFWVMQKKEAIVPGIALFLPPVLVFLVISTWFQLVPNDTIARYFDKASGCGYPIVLKGYFYIYQNRFAGEGAERFTYSASQFTTAVLPVLALACALVFSIRKKLGLSLLRQAAVLLCCGSPLLLIMAGSDSERWIFIALTQIIVIGLLATAKVREAHLGRGLLSGSWAFMVALAVLAALLRLPYFHDEPRPLTLTHLNSFAHYVINQISDPFNHYHN